MNIQSLTDEIIEGESGEIIIIDKEKHEHIVSRKSISLSIYLKNIYDSEPGSTIINLTELDFITYDIQNVVTYLNHYNGIIPDKIKKPIISKTMIDITDNWSATFINDISIKQLWNLLYIANYFYIQSLIDLCSAKIACIIKNSDYTNIENILLSS